MLLRWDGTKLPAPESPCDPQGRQREECQSRRTAQRKNGEGCKEYRFNGQDQWGLPCSCHGNADREPARSGEQRCSAKLETPTFLIGPKLLCVARQISLPFVRRQKSTSHHHYCFLMKGLGEHVHHVQFFQPVAGVYHYAQVSPQRHRIARDIDDFFRLHS